MELEHGFERSYRQINRVKEIAAILLVRAGQGTLKAHMIRGTIGTFALKVVNIVSHLRDEAPRSSDTEDKP